MAKRLTNNIITGNDPHLRMCLYYSPHFDLNIWRRGSSLTSERTQKDPAFKGFRQSSNRLKEASPIAASLYKEVPEKLKQYALYRTLTGRAIKMLKEGLEASAIKEILKKEYIDPLLDAPKSSENRTVEESLTRDCIKGIAEFISYPQTPSAGKRIKRNRRSLSIQEITKSHSENEYYSCTGSDTLLRSGRNVSASQSDEPGIPDEKKRRIKTTTGLIYLGRLPECKKLKIWLRQVDSSGLRRII